MGVVLHPSVYALAVEDIIQGGGGRCAPSVHALAVEFIIQDEHVPLHNEYDIW